MVYFQKLFWRWYFSRNCFQKRSKYENFTPSVNTLHHVEAAGPIEVARHVHAPTLGGVHNERERHGTRSGGTLKTLRCARCALSMSRVATVGLLTRPCCRGGGSLARPQSVDEIEGHELL